VFPRPRLLPLPQAGRYFQKKAAEGALKARTVNPWASRLANVHRSYGALGFCTPPTSLKMGRLLEAGFEGHCQRVSKSHPRVLLQKERLLYCVVPVPGDTVAPSFKFSPGMGV
jgi:hypothetical protein